MNLPEKLLKLYEVATKSEANILITGPSGSGKTMIAKLIHEQSIRRHKPFVSINLASLHEGTLESELFGHERGAYTGAEQRRVGRLEMAQGGTVFLDEIGELPLRLQARLLEFLQSRTIVPVGSNREVRLNVRVIAATNRNLALQVKENCFREDLFHRLRVIAMELPGLASRESDFNEIVHACLDDVCKKYGKSVLRISSGVAQCLEASDWPGNIRELRNVLEFAVNSCEGPEILERDLPQWFLDQSDLQLQRVRSSTCLEIPVEPGYYESLATFEKLYLEQALMENGGRVNQTARKIGMNKTTLMRRLKAHRLAALPIAV